MEIDIEDQFALINFEDSSKAWVLTLLNKSIIINGKGIIIEGFGNFSDTDFENILKGL
jgi:hypothetical protein